MAHGIAEVHVRIRQKHVQVTGFGKTNTGQKYIAANKTLLVTKTGDKNFKTEMVAAVEDMLAQQSLPI